MYVSSYYLYLVVVRTIRKGVTRYRKTLSTIQVGLISGSGGGARGTDGFA